MEGPPKIKLSSDRDAIRNELKDMSFEDLQKLKQQVGAKIYNETVLGVKNKHSASKKFKRLDKTGPIEVSAKLPPAFYRQKPQVPRQKIRDPRFDANCGAFEKSQFEENFKFVDELKAKEREMLGKELEETHDAQQKKKIKYLLQRMDNQVREKTKRERVVQEQLEEKKEIKEKLKRGEKPTYQKKSDKKILALLNKYEELKNTQKLQKHIKKKSKKISGKQLKKIHQNI